MTNQNPKRPWKTGDQYVLGKHEGVTEVLKRASYDEKYRARLLTKDPNDPDSVKKAFNEVGNFELPQDFRVECFEKKGAGVKPESTDNVVILLLPQYYEKPDGVEPLPVALEAPDEGWKCTYFPWDPQNPKDGTADKNTGYQAD